MYVMSHTEDLLRSSINLAVLRFESGMQGEEFLVVVVVFVCNVRRQTTRNSHISIRVSKLFVSYSNKSAIHSILATALFGTLVIFFSLHNVIMTSIHTNQANTKRNHIKANIIQTPKTSV